MNLSLYIHIPFCKSKCFYCSFVSYENKDDLIAPYLEVLAKEASLYKGKQVNTVYIGGGTPTYLDVAVLKTLFSIIHSNFILSEDCEVTIEANPATLDLKKTKVLQDVCVNRVSLGVQSFNDKNLAWLGRPHRSKDAISTFQLLRKAGFNNLNLDLIYSLSHQSEKEIKKDVAELIALGSEHVSLYTLTISEGSKFSERKIEPAPAERQAEHYLLVVDLLKKAGFNHYEVSNFSRKGFECRHNMNYWRAGDYIGLGAAAHSHLGGHRFWNVPELGNYIEMMGEKGSAKAGEERLESPARFMEAFLIGLRLTEGVDLNELEARFEQKMPAEKLKMIDDLVEHGMLAKDKDYIKATLAGMVVLDEICSRLI
jgi:oxygen-independent coproporphyrinogen-3 oxidase